MPPKKRSTTKSNKRSKPSDGFRVEEIEKFRKRVEAEQKAEKEKEQEQEVAETEEEEEMGSEEEEEEESDWSDIDPAFDIGRIDLSFPESIEEFSDSDQCYLPSYYTLAPKERLLLLYAENFRRQFVINFPKRRALVLALPNECNVQKFVCTTIRPTSFLHEPLIGSETGCAQFVADFIIYEPLEDVMKFPTRLVSPTTLLRKRRGNSFEMATLLCSMLIGAGYPAMVVSGVARSETVLNDQRNVPYPHEIVEVQTEEEDKPKVTTGKKYKLRPMPDLESHLEANMAEMMKQKELDERLAREETERLEREELELVAVDRYHYRRSHAWVVIVDNAPWSIQPKKTYLNEDGDVVLEPPKARFIEPSTGFVCETHCKEYILIDSVWNDQNYYVNMQKYQRVGDIRWDLRVTSDWEHLLPGEPPEMRTHALSSEENLVEPEIPIGEEKHLDTIRSWVMKLYIGTKEFEQRYPKLEKAVHYMRAIHERFSPYSQRDGLVMQLTLFSDDEYQEPTVRWKYFENRADLLMQTKYNYENTKTEETFGKGRNDSLRFMEYSADPEQPKYLHFYSAPRLDSLKTLEVHLDRFILHFSNRADRCCYQEFEYKQPAPGLKRIFGRFSRQTSGNVPAFKDIAVRTFLLPQRKILLKFHYASGALTASTLEFTKPPKPNYGQEIKFDPSYAKVYKASVSEPDRTPLELYKLLLEQLKREEVVKKQFEKIIEETTSIFELRKQEEKHPVLKFGIFDPLRNGAARALRMQQNADKEQFKLDMATKPPDFLAPYLVPYNGRELTFEESWAVYKTCLNDLKTRFVGLLNDLQRQYEDLSAEDKSLKRFLNKFEDQFDNYNYECLVQDAKTIELNKRMVQQRLKITHEESQKKYETVKQSLMSDPRLNLVEQRESEASLSKSSSNH